MANIEEIAAFLDKSHVFRRMDDEMLFTIAGYFKEVPYATGKTIVGREEQSTKFYMVYQGQVRLHREEQGQKDVLFVRGDYFGAEALLPKEKSHSEIIAEEDVVLLTLSHRDFVSLKEIIPYLKENLQVSVYGRRLIKKFHFDWIREGEVIYFFGRKHPILLFKAFAVPFAIAIVPFLLLFSAWQRQIISPSILGGIIVVLLFGWTWWRWEDWRNDYYIVTNQRVVWLEKIIGIHDSRQEAPLTEILSVGADVGFWAQFFDYGNVNVRTFVGNIRLHHVHHPYQVRHVIEELWKRAQIVETRVEKEELKAAIIERLTDPDPVEIKKKKEPEKKKTWRERFLPKKERGSLKMRFEQGKTIIYRKHWILLIKHAGLPGTIAVILLLFLGYQEIGILFEQLNIVPISSSILAMILLITMFFGSRTIYQYIDWSNDTFQVTEDKIFDIDRKPFGSIKSRSAPLENIHSIKYERKGFLSYIFNYGTVYIEIGTADFAFEDVRNPAEVQQDLDNRRMARITKEKKAEQKKDRERMVDWILAYHQSAEDLPQILAEINTEKFDKHEEG